jgi:hypothetical protein
MKASIYFHLVLIIWSVITNCILGQSRVIRKFELDKIINFSSVAWMYPPTHKIIERIIRQSARYIFALTRYDAVKILISEELKWLFPKYAHQYEVLKLCFMTVRGCVPQYFS